MTDKKQKIIYLKGLIGSGKSTWANQLVRDNPEFVRLNKDNIRIELHNGEYSKENEKEVVETERKLAEQYLREGKSVVIDNTGFSDKHFNFYTQLAKRLKVDFEVNDSFLQTPLLTCIERDSKRENPVGEQAIRKMYHEYIKKPKTAIEYDPSLPMAVIVDIDGTLAHMNGKRSPYDFSKVWMDDVDEGVAHLVDAINYLGYAKVFIFSGREETCRDVTEEWLEKNAIEYEFLAMRPTRDMRPDTEVKAEMYYEHLHGKYNVLFVVDDRPVVCRQWRDHFGFRVMQVGDPYMDF